MRITTDEIKIGKRLLVKEAQLTLPSSGLAVLHGRNGVGKTLWMKYLFEQFLKEKKSVIFVDQNKDEMIEDKTILENIAMTNEEEEIERVKAFLHRYQFDYLLERDVRKLSGGEQRIICLLRGFLHPASLLIIDEPTNDLDYTTVNKVLTMIEEIRKKKLILVISHDDRILKCADCEYELKDKMVVQKTVNQEEQTSPLERQSKDNGREAFLAGIVKKNYFLSIFLFLLLLFTTYSFNQYTESNFELSEDWLEGEVDIFIPISQMGVDSMTGGALPIAALACFQDSLSISEKLQTFRTIATQYSELGINYGLNLEESTDYDVFVLEYYDPAEKMYYDTMDLYREKLGMGADAVIDTSKYFASNEDDEEAVAELDPVLFYECQEELESLWKSSGVKLEATYVAVKIRDEDGFYQFIQSAEVGTLVNGNFYVVSKETVQLYNQLMSFQGRRNLLFAIAGAGILFLGLEMILVYMYLFKNGKKFSIIKNQGGTNEGMLPVMKKKMEDQNWRILSVLLVGVINYGFSTLQESQNIIGSYLPTFLFLVIVYLGHKLRGVMVTRYMKKIFSWRYR